MTILASKSKRVIDIIRDEISVMIFSTTHRHLPRVLANSMPKAGTHLLIRLLILLGFRKRRDHLDIGTSAGLQYISMGQIERARHFLTCIKPGHFSSSHFFFYPEHIAASKRVIGSVMQDFGYQD